MNGDRLKRTLGAGSCCLATAIRCSRRIAVFGSLVVALTLAGAGCAESTEVRLGAIVSLQGVGSPYGRSVQNGIELAVEEINAAGGINVNNATMLPLVIDIRDAASSTTRATEAARELIAAGVPAVIGADISELTLAIAPLFEEAEIILMSPATSSPKLSSAGDYIYRNFPSDELEAINTADFIYNKQGLREAAIIANQNEYGIGIKNAFIERFRAIGGREAGQVSYPPEVGDLSAQIDDLASINAPAIYIAGYIADTAAVVMAIRDAGITTPLYGTGAILADQLVAAGGAAVEGLVFPQPSFIPTSDEPAVRSFVAAYRQKYGPDPDAYAAHAYDAVRTLALAIQENGVNPRELRFYLNSMSPYEGATGATDFDANGDVRKFHRMFRIEAGAAVPIPVQ